LPQGYEVISANYPSQVLTEADGRIKLSFMNDGNGAVSYQIKGRKLLAGKSSSTKGSHPWPNYEPKPQGRDQSKARLSYQPNERAYQNREIVYFMQQPTTHSFRLYHDYTESREGVNKYVNIVRPGSKASKPSALILDTGEQLKVETLKGKEITDKGIEIENLDESTEIVVIWFAPVKKGQTVRLRIEETYTDPNRYLLYNNELIWDRSFGRNRNAIVMPDNWYLTTNSIPAIISLNEAGKIRLDYVNPRPDNIEVFIKGKQRK